MQPRQNQNKEEKRNDSDLALSQIIDKIQESDSILIALSQNPSVDELATAVGLGMFIDKMNKHATAIYSGETPNVLAFLKPEQQFETNTNGLQDFIIAINKDKADHLRYKLDGDYVKVYITPYRTTISESDLEFSHGDYNVDLVIALNVDTPDRLDAALSEHGRIMHDATIINIAAGVPGKFGEIEWSNPVASSVAEMVAKLMMEMKNITEIDKEIATAVLTGIVAATERFSNGKTRPETMAVASQLMTLGADQQLISANIIKEEAPRAFEINREEENAVAVEPEKPEPEMPADETVLDVKAAAQDQDVIVRPIVDKAPSVEEKVVEPEVVNPVPVASESVSSVSESVAPAVPEPVTPVVPEPEVSNPVLDNPVLPPVEELTPVENAAVPELVMAEPIASEQVAPVVPEPVAPVAPAVPEPEVSNPVLDNPVLPPVEELPPVESTVASNPVLPPVEEKKTTVSGMPTLNSDVMAELKSMSAPKPEVVEPDLDEREAEIAALPGVLGKDYSSMIEEALSEADDSNKKPTGPIGSGYLGENPALKAAPEVSDKLEENNIPKMSFDQPVDMSDENKTFPAETMKSEEGSINAGAGTEIKESEALAASSENMPGGESGGDILPPPPAPPIDFNNSVLPQVEDMTTGEVAAAEVFPKEMSSATGAVADAPVNPVPEASASAVPASEVPASAVPQKQEDLGVKSDPGAFRIPGM